MIFSNSTTKAGIVEDIDFLVNTDSTSYPIAQKTRNINTHFDNVVSLILSSDSRWKWADSNDDSHPIGTITLVNGTQDYELAGGTYLKILRVEVKDINGKYQLIHPIDDTEVQNQAMTEFQGSDAGMPKYYDKLGEYIFLYPKPSSAMVTTTAGLKVYYQRTPSYFATTDTTKVPGFAPLYHRILSVGAALDYAISQGMNGKINTLTPMLKVLQDGLVQHYSTREADTRTRMTIAREDFGQEDYGMGTSDRSISW